jgi:hypothetical protein
MGVLTRFRLDGGTNQQAARKLLPAEGLLRRVVNLRLVRDNELGVRPGATALTMTVYGQGGNITICDVFGYDGRLFGIGHISGGSNVAKIALFEYLGLVKGWVRLVQQLSPITQLRELASPPDQTGGITSATVAVDNGYGVLAYAIDSTVALASRQNYGLAFQANSDSTIVFDLLSLLGPAMAIATVGHKFHMIGLDSLGTSLAAQTFDPTTDTAFGVANGLQSVDTAIFAAAAVAGSTGGYVTVGCKTGNLVVRHYNDSHVQQMTRTINTIVPNYLAIAAHSTANIIVIGYLDNADSLLKYKTISLTAGTDVAGPTSLSATATTGAISVSVDSAGTLTVAGNITTTTPRKVVFFGGNTVTATWTDAQLTTEALYLSTEASVVAGFIQGNATVANFGVQGLGVQSVLSFPGFFKDFGTAMEWPGRIGSLTRDASTGKVYMTALRQNNDLEGTVCVTEFSYGALERRQVALLGGLLHIAGALPMVFDGRFPTEISWGEAPVVYSLASSNTASGAITSSAAYFIQVFPEMVDARGNVHRGPPSDVYSITTGAADDTLTGTIGRLHSYRNAGFWDGAAYRMVICRTAALADKTAGENLYRETHVACPRGLSTNWGSTVSFTLTTSDDGLRTLGESQGTIYTQGQTPVPHQAPPPASYLWSTNERLAAAGLPRTSQWLQSKLRFPAEGTHFSDSDLPEYQGNADEAILAVGALSSNLAAFTRRTISLWQGEGPDHSGVGEFSFAGFLSRQGGILDWRSLVETDDGLFFQREKDQFCFLSRAGGVDWTLGQAIRDELVTYPNVLAAVHLRQQHCIAVAVENDAANAGETLIYDLRRKTWTIDTIYAKALCEHQGRLVYVDSSGNVFQQDATAGSGAMPDQNFETFDFDFGTGLSWGEFIGVGLVGTKDGDCTVTLDVTFDSGANYSTIGTWTVTTAGNYTTGKPIELKKANPDRWHSRFGLRWNVTGGTGTLGVRINEIVLETEKAPGMTRLPARDTQ